jgi:AcrR family transcriptional regulator
MSRGDFLKMEKILSKREQNKVQKKAAFIDAAERLFIQKGFENTSIDEVAKEAGLTKRTLYQYFNSKEDLFYAVTVEGARQLYSSFSEAISKGNSALEKIRLTNQAYLHFYKEYLGMFRLLNYQPANMQNSMASPHFRELGMLNGIRMQHLADIVALGRTDGSINPDLDMKKAVFFAFFSGFSLLFTVSAADKSMWEMLQMDEDEFIQFCFNMYSDALR